MTWLTKVASPNVSMVAEHNLKNKHVETYTAAIHSSLAGRV